MLRPLSNDLGMVRERVSVGLFQLQEETRESKQLESHLDGRIEELKRRVRMTGEGLSDVEADIERTRQPASTAFSEEVSQIDVEIGRLEERRKQWQRIASALNEREEISEKITDLQLQISKLDDAVERRNRLVDFTSVSDVLADGMNDYLTSLNVFRPNAWV